MLLNLENYISHGIDALPNLGVLLLMGEQDQTAFTNEEEEGSRGQPFRHARTIHIIMQRSLD